MRRGPIYAREQNFKLKKAEHQILRHINRLYTVYSERTYSIPSTPFFIVPKSNIFFIHKKVTVIFKENSPSGSSLI